MSNHEDHGGAILQPPVRAKRLNVTVEPEARAMLAELVTRLYPGRTRVEGLVIEQAIRAYHRSITGKQNPAQGA